MAEKIVQLKKKTLTVNGQDVMVIADEEAILSDVIRKQLGLTGIKVGCRAGQCGVCSVILNGKLVRSCVMKMKRVDNFSTITTIEGIGTPGHLHPLQQAFIKHGTVQCGFCNPGFIVSAKALLDQNTNPTRADVRKWFQVNRNACRCTGYKQIVDAVMDAAKVMRGEMKFEELQYDFAAEKTFIGSYAPRPSGEAKVCGVWNYGADLGLQLPASTLRLALVQAKVSHAKILSIDTAAAEKMPGVEKIVTHKDIKGSNRIFGFACIPGNTCDGYDRPILCDDKVFMYGDAIAIVCADTDEHAKAAAAAVKVELEELPAYMNAADAMAEDAIQIHPGLENVYFEQSTVKGEDTKPIFASAPVVVEGSYHTTRQPHLVLEPDVGFSYYDEEGKLTIHSKSIALYIHIDMICEGLGIPKEELRIVQNPTGGTFGYKISITVEALLAAATMATGKPCYLEFDMEQTITYTGKREVGHVDIKMAADKDGKLQGLEYQHIFDHGAYSEWGDIVLFKGNQFIGAGYDFKNIRGHGKLVCTNHTYGTAFRSYGSPQSLWASECLIDELAEKIGMDPLELRYKNVYRPGATTPTGQEPEVYSLPEQIEWLRPKYQAALKSAKEKSTADKKYGVGIALANYCCGGDFGDMCEVRLELAPHGVTIYSTWQDHGQGSDMGTKTILHEALKPLHISMEQIKMVMNDTGTAPDGGCSAGSRGQLFYGNAMIDASEKLLDAMRKEDGTFRTYDEMVAEGIELAYTGSWASGQYCTMIERETAQCNPSPTYMYGMFMSEVVVDMKTGKATVEKMTMTADNGTIINKLSVDGQMFGSYSQGVGFALTEQYDDLDKHKTLAGCGFPYIMDIPDEMHVEYFENKRELGPYGASGVGELPLSSPHASIANAVNNACGVRIRDLPLLPEKILAGLKK